MPGVSEGQASQRDPASVAEANEWASETSRTSRTRAATEAEWTAAECVE